ncbi:DC-STAMP domain-containing protein 2-like [Topomyia yanbarensis]|uniref:DC-STAMP domain-containing protein 2-like n=1 Tax=Topomyia yanbarensis TaxID=2498891 RepID=UPI00273B22FA|nr:DC-STAMP domain-containing protein 2-like [Topomyia yanbarensis]
MPSRRHKYQTTTKKKSKHKVYKIAFGLVLGLIKTVALYFLLRYQFDVNPQTTIIAVVILGFIFTIVSARSSSFQCLTLLMVPQILSKRGRAAMIAYAFVLAINGPARNAIANIDAVGEAITCGQQKLRAAIHDALQAAKVPFVALKKAIGEILSEVEKTFAKVQQVLKRILLLIKRILNSIQAGYQWLSNVVSLCNKKIGSPFDRCYKALESAVDDCKERLPGVGFLCEVTHVAKLVCYSVKFIDFMCELIDFASDGIVKDIERKLQEYIHNMKIMFSVKVDFDHAFAFKTNSSKTFSQITHEIKQEISAKSKSLFTLFNIFGVISSFCFLCVIIRSIRYKMKYLTKDQFDNCYLSRDFEEIDGRRKTLGRETLLPLTRKERNRYINLTSASLTRKEQFRIARNAVFLFVSSVQILGLVSADYCLFWLLITIRHATLKQAGIETPPMVTLEVGGSGIIADMYRGIVGAFEPMVKHLGILDPVQCAPEPRVPNLTRYLQICLILLFCWMCIVLEPYGLRVRQLIMRAYYPERARERAVWLYNDILLKRETFVKMVRRQLAFGRNGDTQEAVSWMDVIRAKTNRFWICRKILGDSKAKRCILCSTKLMNDDLISCLRPGCPGVYCYECCLEAHYVCSICSERMDFGDLSNDSIERDSSEEEPNV